ncbi:hypothetical protein [Catenulispora rubra]|uniref:hypothetical protein n=1 Tax=Catenulispora rubra TaxID=280293 RepID=UPI001892108C|nr:hypothetical protein [Catenulispora rubra]
MTRLAEHVFAGTRPPLERRVLIRAYAYTQAVALDPEPERDCAVGSLLHYYAHTAQAASQATAQLPRPKPTGPTPAYLPDLRDSDARAWLRTERPNLDAAQAGAVDALAQALKIFRTTGERGNEAWTLNYYAAAIAAAGDRPRALALYEQALAMNQELNKPDDEAISLEGIAEHQLAVGDVSRGTEILRQVLGIYERLSMNADVKRVQARLTDLAWE